MKTSGQHQVCMSQAAVGSCKAPAPSVISATSLVSTPNPISGKATVSGQLYHRFISLSFLWSRIFLEGLQFSSVAQSCPTLCDPMDHSTPGLPVHHQLPEFTQSHVHRVDDAIHPSHSLSSPSLPALNVSQHQGLLRSVSSSHQVSKVLEFQPQHQSFQ